MKKLIFTLSIFFLPIAGHGIMAILGNEDARFFLHWSMLIASLIGSGFGCLIVCGAAALRTKHDICEDLLFKQAMPLMWDEQKKMFGME